MIIVFVLCSTGWAALSEKDLITNNDYLDEAIEAIEMSLEKIEEGLEVFQEGQYHDDLLGRKSTLIRKKQEMIKNIEKNYSALEALRQGDGFAWYEVLMPNGDLIFFIKEQKVFCEKLNIRITDEIRSW